jgi:NAD/NADP transhydrogenase beta subunit
MSGRGDCFLAAAHMVMEDSTLVLVHGTVVGTGGAVLGQRFCHAWCEDGDGMVLDHSNGRKLEVPAELYYSVGAIENIRRYSSAEAAAQMFKTGIYGPWDPVFNAWL